MELSNETIELIVSEYETLIDDRFQNAATVSELEEAHKEAKEKIAEKHFDLKDISASSKAKVLEAIENTYTQLKDFCELKDAQPKTRGLVASKHLKNLRIEQPDIAIGIDLGTTMCCVAVLINGKVEIIPNKTQGNVRTTPSYVLFSANGSDAFGVTAKQKAYRFPELTIYDAKRMIGRDWNDENLQNDIKSWPFEVLNENGNVKIKTGNRIRYPHEVSARLLAAFRGMAEEYLNLPYGSITKAVITVPAYFTEPQRRATDEAAACAGLKVLNILSEPSAAAIAYNYDRQETEEKTVLIYDLGGGTFDVAIAKVKPNNVEILAVDGDTHLGGQDFDQALMDYCIQKFAKSEGIDLLEGKNSTDKTLRDSCKRALSRVKLQCERVKEQLSGSDEALVEVIGITEDKNMEITIKRAELEEMIKPVIKRTIDIVERAIKAAKSKGISSMRDIDDVILIGGSTRMPLVMQMVKEYFDEKESCQHINPDEAVAYGAAVQAGIFNKHKGVHPYLQVYDVLPMSIGVEINGDKMSVILPRNTRIPCEYQKVYATTTDYQTQMKFTLYQGDQYWSYDNKKLGQFYLQDIPARRSGEEKAKVTMTIDFMGILHVTAVSLTTEQHKSITITSDKLGMDAETIKQLSETLRPRPPAMAQEE